MKTGKIILAALLVSLVFLAAYIFTFPQQDFGIIAGILVVKLLTGFFILKFRSARADLEFRQIFTMSFFIQLFSYVFIQVVNITLVLNELSKAGAPDTAALATAINMSLIGFVIMISVVPLAFSGIMYGVDKIISPPSKTDELR
ncbi:MAG: hypothetical protein K0S32_777 [Bacteroidetes bacterium]|jgi:hypothetical protein|nr:hypothetical protein [Bacteroidota bacterium]